MRERNADPEAQGIEMVEEVERATQADDGVILQAIIDHRLLAITKEGEHLFAGRRGSKPQATIRKDALEKNIAYFWVNVKWESDKNKYIPLQIIHFVLQFIHCSMKINKMIKRRKKEINEIRNRT